LLGAAAAATVELEAAYAGAEPAAEPVGAAGEAGAAGEPDG